MKPLPRPQRKHLFFFRVENLGFFLLRAITDVLAIFNNTRELYNITLFFFKSTKMIDLKEKSGLLKAVFPCLP